ncbi:hypothetical protein J6590_061233 [Homalodisca vitripennis]|nr:hypothetical protein J6590_061233 [Homalodisca vitripennis]
MLEKNTVLVHRSETKRKVSAAKPVRDRPEATTATSSIFQLATLAFNTSWIYTCNLESKGRTCIFHHGVHAALRPITTLRSRSKSYCITLVISAITRTLTGHHSNSHPYSSQ